MANQKEIVAGADATITVYIKNEDGSPKNLAAVTDAELYFRTTTGKLTKAFADLTITAATGKIVTTLTESQTATLKTGVNPIYGKIVETDATSYSIKGLEKALKVIPLPF